MEISCFLAQKTTNKMVFLILSFSPHTFTSLGLCPFLMESTQEGMAAVAPTARCQVM